MFQAILLATLADIKSPVWGLSIHGGGSIAEGLNSIRQCIDLIIRTTKGTDPLRPEFGSDVYKYHDHPVNVAVPLIKKAILDAIATWEKRVNLTYVRHFDKLENLQFEIGYALVDQDLNDTLILSINNGGIDNGTDKKRLILQGFFPPNPFNRQYFIECILDGKVIMPVAPEDGFSTQLEMYQWVKDNWLNYGQWYLTADSIVGYMNTEYTTGSLTITLLKKIKFMGEIPGLIPDSGEIYGISITVDGNEYYNDLSGAGLTTPDQVREWAQENIGYLGTWKLETLPGEFNDDFSEDFFLYRIMLTIYTDQAESVIINIQIVSR